MKFVGLLLLLLVGLVVLWFGVASFRGAETSLSWPSVAGTIQLSEAHAGSGCVSFSYQVAGQPYSSTTVQYHEEGTTEGDRSPSCHDGVVARYRSGNTVRVYYDPQNPAYGILEPGPNFGIFLVPGVGAAFSLLGIWLVWKQFAIRYRVRRGTPSPQTLDVPGQAVEPHGLGDLVESSLVTPSEVVAIHGAQFAARTLGGNVLLLDGATEVSARELAAVELKAAILAHELSGTIQLEISETPDRKLYIVPAATRFPWPSPSTESRIEFPAREEASAAVRRWLAEQSIAPWERAAEKLHIPLVLRRAAVVSQTGRKRRYILIDRKVEAAAAHNLTAVSGLLRGCESERPEVWKLLSAAIETAVEGSTLSGKATPDPSSPYVWFDPWYDEAANDAKSVPGLKLFGEVGTPWWQVIIWAVILWSAVAAVAWYSFNPYRIALGTGVALAGLMFAAILKWGRDWVRGAASRWPVSRPALESALEGDPRKSALIVVPLGALAIVAIYSNVSDPRAIAVIAAGVLIGGMGLLKKQAGAAITGRVVGSPASVAAPASIPRTSVAAAGASAVSTLETPLAALPFDIEIVRPADLSQVSESARSRIQAIRERGPKVRRLYGRATFMIAACSMAVALVAWRLLAATPDLGSFPWFTAVLFVVTLGILGGARSENAVIGPIFLIGRYALRYLRGGSAQERNRWEKEIKPIRPVLAPLLGWAWMWFTLARGLVYWNGPAPAKWAPVTLTAAIVIGYVFRLRRGRKALERQYPIYPTLNLLALRVFGSPSRDRFLELLDLWHWFGPIYRLDGPDTAGGKSSDVVAYVTGRLDAAVTENQAELEEALRNFAQTRDSQLRFPFNSLQSNDRTWKEALQNMLDRADIVVMDLSALKEKNRGCAYEIGKLVNEVPLERFLLLIDDETDIDFLRRLLGEATAGQSIGTSPRKLRLFHLGTLPRRKENESVYEWQHRTTTPIDADRLVGLLCDAACTRHPAAQSPIFAPWTRPGYRSSPFA